MKLQHFQPSSSLYEVWRLLRGEGLVFAGALLVSRIVLLLVLGYAIKGQEFTDDIGFQKELIADPWQLVEGRSETIAESFPPLLPFFMAAIGGPLSAVVSPFYACRLVLLTYEVLAWAFVWAILCRLTERLKERRILAIIYLISPVTWMTSTVMCQDETISLLFFSIVIWYTIHARYGLAAFWTGTGVVCAKVFFLLFFPVLLLAGAWHIRRWLQIFCLTFLPIALVYVWVVPARFANGSGLPLVNFVLPTVNSISLWMLLGPRSDLPLGTQKNISSLLVFAACMGALLWIRLRGGKLSQRAQAVLMGANWCWFCTFFFHVNPEYYLLIAAAGIWFFRPWGAAISVGLGLSLTWAMNFFYGVAAAEKAGATGGKKFFVDLYYAATGGVISPDTALVVTNLIFAIVSVAIASRLTVCAARKSKSNPLLT